MTIYRSILAWLAALSADPAEIDREPPRAAAAVAAAYATFAPQEAPLPPPAPAPQECGCGGKCVNGRFRPDGVIWQDCKAGCKTCPKPPAPRGG